MATVKAVLNKDRMKKDGDYALVVQIIHKRIKRVIYTPYKLKEIEFNRVTRKAIYTDGVRYTHKQIREINNFVERKKEEIEKVIIYLAKYDKHFTAADIARKYYQDQSDKYLITYTEKLIAKKEAFGKMGSARAFLSTLHSLKRFIGTRIIEFSNIDHHFVKEYE